MQHFNSKPKSSSFKGLSYGINQPTLSRPADWLIYINKSNLGNNISQEKIIQCTISQLHPKTPEGKAYIRSRIKSEWHRFDEKNKLHISKQKLPKTGIINFLMSLTYSYNSYIRKSYYSNENTCSCISNNPIIYSNTSEKRAPNLNENPSGWFDYYDIYSVGMLTQEQIFNGIFDSITFPKTPEDEETIRKRVTDIWCIFDKDKTGEISKGSFLDKECGLADILLIIANDYSKAHDLEEEQRKVQRRYSHLNRVQKRHSYLPPPILSEDPQGWFDHFDSTQNGKLTLKEVIIALYSSFNATSKEKQELIKEIVKSNWYLFDEDGDGIITKEDFLGFQNGESLSKILIDLEQRLNFVAVDRPQDESEETFRVKVNIPVGMEPFSLIQVFSPKTKKLVMLSIPRRSIWGGGEYSHEPYYFTVKF